MILLQNFDLPAQKYQLLYVPTLQSEREAIKVFDELAKKSHTDSHTDAKQKTGDHHSTDNHLFFHHFLASLAGVEPATYGFVVCFKSITT